MTLVGMIDDLVKIRSAAKGISARLQAARTIVGGRRRGRDALPAAGGRGRGIIVAAAAGGTQCSLGSMVHSAGRSLVIVGASNAVNLADGLDGLAGGCLLAATAAMTGAGVRRRTRRVGGLSRRAAHSPRRRNDRLGRRHDRRHCWASSGSTAIPPKSSWAIRGHCRWAACWACWPWSPDKNCCWWSSAACSSPKRQA